jgi:hypothetical protein
MPHLDLYTTPQQPKLLLIYYGELHLALVRKKLQILLESLPVKINTIDLSKFPDNFGSQRCYYKVSKQAIGKTLLLGVYFKTTGR